MVKIEQNQEAPSKASAGSDRGRGLVSVLVACYVILAMAATFRSSYQIISRFEEAPVAYTLSAIAGLVYIVAAVALVKGRKGDRPGWRMTAWIALGFELAGVLTVGTLSLLLPDMFGHDTTVWSYYGSGYLWIPLALPVLGMLWLRRERANALEESAPQPNESL